MLRERTSRDGRPWLLTRASHTATTALVVFVLIGPLVIGAAAIFQLNQSPSELDPPVSPVHAMVARRSSLPTLSVIVRSDDFTLESLVAPPESAGLVNRTLIEEGDVLGTFQAIAEVSGRTVFTAATEEPFYRSLAAGAKGDDVAMLQGFLLDAGFRTLAPTGQFDRDTAREVASFNAASGRTGATFEVSSVVWVAHPGSVVTDVHIEVGRVIPSSGDLLLSAVRSEGGRIAHEDGREVIVDTPSSLRFNGKEVAIVVSSAIDSELLASLFKLSSQSTQPSEDVGDSSTERASQEFAVGLSVPVEVVSTVEVAQYVVPVGSVVTMTTGGPTCLFVLRSSGGYEAFPTEVISGEFGYLAVSPAPAEAAQILVNPLEVMRDLSCG